MIVINLSVTVMISPEFLEHQLSEERAFQTLKAIRDREREEQRAAIEQLQAMTHKIACSCGWSGTGYETPGKARMALSGHRRWCHGS